MTKAEQQKKIKELESEIKRQRGELKNRAALIETQSNHIKKLNDQITKLKSDFKAPERRSTSSGDKVPQSKEKDAEKRNLIQFKHFGHAPD